MTMKEKKNRVKNWDAIYKFLDSVLSVAVLPFAIYALFTRSPGDELKDRLFSAAFFLAFALSFVCQALRKKIRNENMIWQLAQAGVYLLSVILILVIPGPRVSLPIITILFAAMMITGRVISLVKKHTYRNFSLNVPWILLVTAAAVWDPEKSFMFVCMAMLAMDLIHIVSLSFSGMDMILLLKVIRKTYAADVLSGLILFMAAFSIIFPVVEKNITSFRDAIWYCFAIVTTIGFGDFAATSSLGRVMSVILGVYGIVVVAMITSVIVNFYSELKKRPDEDEDLE